MKLRIMMAFLVSVVIFPSVVFAQDLSENILEKENVSTKYYKSTTVIKNNNYNINVNNENVIISQKTEEISEDEYNSADESYPFTAGSVTIETTYKKMTTSITSSGSTYRYKNELVWKNNPKIRSYDTIAIGHYASVKPKTIKFSQQYCTSTTDCTTSTTFTSKKFSTGTAATFKLPVGSYVSLKQTLYFDVEKNVDAKILKQIAVGDYAHATKTISSANSLKYSVSVNGIELESSITDYYDSINVAQASWTGSW